MIERKQPGRTQKRVQDTLLKSGEKALGHEAVIAPDKVVREAGLRRLGRNALIAGAGVALAIAAGSVIGNALDREDQAHREQTEADTEWMREDQTEPTLPHTVRRVEPGENPSIIAAEYNARPQDAQAMAEDIQARYADENGYIHPGQEIDIAPPHEEEPVEGNG